MSQAFECWDKDDPDGVKRIESGWPGTAAELFVERQWEAVDGCASYEIEVRDSFGAMHSFVVTVESQPIFCARPVRPTVPSGGDGESGPLGGARP